MVKDKYKGTDVTEASTDHIIRLLEELFKDFDLNDNKTIDFNNFMSELKNRYTKHEKNNNAFNIVKSKLTQKQWEYIWENL